MAEADCYQHASLVFDDEGLPMWGQASCTNCYSYGWITSPGEHEELGDVTSVDCCYCCFPVTDEDTDRLYERLKIVASQLTRSAPDQYNFLMNDVAQDLH
jgi:hypothetical protein